MKQMSFLIFVLFFSGLVMGQVVFYPPGVEWRETTRIMFRSADELGANDLPFGIYFVKIQHRNSAVTVEKFIKY